MVVTFCSVRPIGSEERDFAGNASAIVFILFSPLEFDFYACAQPVHTLMPGVTVKCSCRSFALQTCSVRDRCHNFPPNMQVVCQVRVIACKVARKSVRSYVCLSAAPHL